MDANPPPEEAKPGDSSGGDQLELPLEQQLASAPHRAARRDILRRAGLLTPPPTTPAQPPRYQDSASDEWRWNNTATILVGLGASTFFWLWPNVPIFVKWLAAFAMWGSFAYPALTVPPRIRNASRWPKIIICALLTLGYAAALITNRDTVFEDANAPHITAQISEMVTSQRLRGEPDVQLKLWVLIQNSGRADPILPDWSLEIRSKSGAPLRTALSHLESPIAIVKMNVNPDGSISKDAHLIKEAPEMQIWDYAYRSPVSPTNPLAGFLIYDVPDATSVEMLDLSSARLRFSDAHREWISEYYDPRKDTQGHLAGQPFPTNITLPLPGQ